MFARRAMNSPSTRTLIARRGFSSTRTQLASPYHYPEGPRSNIPFNPLTRWFALRYWGFMGTWVERCAESSYTNARAAVGFFAPFGIAGEHLHASETLPDTANTDTRVFFSLADEEERLSGHLFYWRNRNRIPWAKSLKRSGDLVHTTAQRESHAGSFKSLAYPILSDFFVVCDSMAPEAP